MQITSSCGSTRGASGSSSDALIFNRGNLKRRIENGTLGLPPPEPLGPGGPDLHYFLLGDDAFALMPWLVKPYSRRQLTREERIQDIQGRRVVENSYGILVKRFRVLLTTMEQRLNVVRDIMLTCLVLHFGNHCNRLCCGCLCRLHNWNGDCLSFRCGEYVCTSCCGL